ncbi:DUF58 domain-containing protein [Ferviditalea candida]|uniref:DUF58 domain-containing protein n=1 Tax=Ferviditalea candida TaxID=3108399 RepID=A0ABU5ZM04_9BACL|nr:DUF58 domain-containing protein [Paenibacillaceae bacterium T2]
MSYLLDPSFLRRLERMQVVSRRMMSGSHMGKRRSRSLGSSLEFADFRSYYPGDDLRQLDWNAYARLGKLLLKTFLDERELHITLYLDCSLSMNYGSPSKFAQAVQLAAALGYVSLQHLDRVSVYAFEDRVTARQPFLLGKGKSHALFQFLNGLRPGGTGSINRALRSGAAIHGKPGVSVILSDFLFEDGYEAGISFVQASQQEVILVQMLTEEERRPQLQGDLRLIDSETQAGKEIALSPPVLKDYRQSLADFQSSMKAFAARRGMVYVDADPSLPIEDIVFKTFAPMGLIR